MLNHRAWRLFMTLSLGGAACSVVNHFDDVVPAKGTGGAGGAGGTNGGNGMGGSSAGATNGGTTPKGGGTATGGSNPSSGGRAPGEGGAAGASPLGGSAGLIEAGAAGAGGIDNGGLRPVPTKGLVVVGGTNDKATVGLLSVLDPTTGTELNREALAAGVQVAAIGYDGADGKDVWFIFVSADNAFPAKPDKVVNLQVRYFNDRTNNWRLVSRFTTLPPPVPGSIAVLNDRIAYLSHTVVNSVVTPSLTILDTSDLADVKPVTFAAPSATGDMLMLLGTRGTPDDTNGLGGTLDLGYSQPDSATLSNLFVQPIAVGSAVSYGVGKVVGGFRGTPVGAASTEQLDFFAMAPATGSVVVSRIAPNAPEAPTTYSAPPSATDLSALTVAECQHVVILTADTEATLWGVTPSGIGKALPLGRPGQLVAYEPFTGDAITTYNPPNNAFLTDTTIPGPDISAVRVVSPSSSSLTLTRRIAPQWAAPTDVRANTLTTRVPFPITCP